MSSFKEDDQVKWTSQAGGCTTKKVGKVVRVVPRGAMPGVVDLAAQLAAVNNYGGGLPRNHESYLVLVPGKTPRGKSALYWPLVSKLTKV